MCMIMDTLGTAVLELQASNQESSLGHFPGPNFPSAPLSLV